MEETPKSQWIVPASNSIIVICSEDRLDRATTYAFCSCMLYAARPRPPWYLTCYVTIHFQCH